jgi:pimeloyl-ACP methyl ester carboxylesterase
MPSEIPLTWILTSRDRVLSVKQQRASMAALGGVDDVELIDTCHNAMISRPDQVAAILGDRLDQQ